jgi:hypothetical protein
MTNPLIGCDVTVISQQKSLPFQRGRLFEFYFYRKAYDSFTCFRFSRRPFELAGRLPWLALFNFRFVFAIVPNPEHYEWLSYFVSDPDRPVRITLFNDSRTLRQTKSKQRRITSFSLPENPVQSVPEVFKPNTHEQKASDASVA